MTQNPTSCIDDWLRSPCTHIRSASHLFLLKTVITEQKLWVDLGTWVHHLSRLLAFLPVVHLRRQEKPQNTARLVFMFLVVSEANEWEDYSNSFGERAEISRNWATAHLLSLWLALELSWCLWVYHLTYWCITVSVYWGSRSSGSQRLLSWTCLVLISLCCVPGLWCSFKVCALTPFFLFQFCWK